MLAARLQAARSSRRNTSAFCRTTEIEALSWRAKSVRALTTCSFTSQTASRMRAPRHLCGAKVCIAREFLSSVPGIRYASARDTPQIESNSKTEFHSIYTRNAFSNFEACHKQSADDRTTECDSAWTGECFAMDTVEDPDDRDLRRRQLAKRLVSHHARTQTIYGFTGFTRHRLATLRKRWGVAPEERHRGPSPKSFSVFFRTPKARSIATTAAVICELMGLTKTVRQAKLSNRTLDLAFGEQLCEVHEALKACFPDVELEFEQVMLLAIGLSSHESIDLTTCTKCGIALLADQLSLRRRTCASCHRPAAPASSVNSRENEQSNLPAELNERSDSNGLPAE